MIRPANSAEESVPTKHLVGSSNLSRGSNVESYKGITCGCYPHDWGSIPCSTANCLTAKNSVYSLTARTEGCDSSDKGSIPFRQTMGAKRNGIAARPEPVCPIRVGGSYPSSARHFLRLAERHMQAHLKRASSRFESEVEDQGPIAELAHAPRSRRGVSRFESELGYHRRLGKLVNLPDLESGFSRFESEISDHLRSSFNRKDAMLQTLSLGFESLRA